MTIAYRHMKAFIAPSLISNDTPLHHLDARSSRGMHRKIEDHGRTGPWNRRHVHRPGIKSLSLVQHMGPKHISITHRQHGVVVYGANQTKSGISSIRPGCSLLTNASPTRSPKGWLRPIVTPLCRARARSVLHHSSGTNSPQTSQHQIGT